MNNRASEYKDAIAIIDKFAKLHDRNHKIVEKTGRAAKTIKKV